jgi:hypothetical protein
MAETRAELERRHEYPGESGHFGECQPIYTSPNQNMLRVRKHGGRTFLSRPRIKTGSIFKLSLMDNCALAPAPAAVMLLLYAESKSTNRWLTYSRLSSSLWVSDRSTALSAKKVASAIWSAEA